MQEQIREKLEQVLEKWKNFERNQKIKIIAISLILLVALFVTIYFITRPKLVTLFPNLELTETAQVQEALNSMSIYNKTAQGGKSILVKAQDLDRAKIQLSAEDIPKTSQTFADALTQMGMGTTETVKREIILRQKEIDLSNAIRSIEGINNATVKLFIPDKENNFIKTNQKASSSVLLDLNQEFSSQQVDGIARFVASSVEGLDSSDVVVLDSHSNIISIGDQDNIDGSNRQLEIEIQRQRTIEENVKNTFGPLYDDVRVQANVKLDWDNMIRRITQRMPYNTDSNKGLPETVKTKTAEAENAQTGEEPGVGTNTGTIPGYDTGEAYPSRASSDENETNYIYDTIETTTERSTADYIQTDSSIAVMLYNVRIYEENAIREQGLLENTSWDDYKANIKSQLTRLTVPTDLVDTVKSGTGIETVSVVGYEIPQFIDSIPTLPRPWENYIPLAILTILIALLAFGLIRRTVPEEITEIEPELEIEQLLVSSKDEEEQAQELQEIDYASDSELKLQIDKFVDVNPEAVAQLLRNWLSDEWE